MALTLDVEVETMRDAMGRPIRQIATLTFARPGMFIDALHSRGGACPGHLVSTIHLGIVGDRVSGIDTWACTHNSLHDTSHSIGEMSLAAALRRYAPHLTWPDDDADRILEQIARARG